jgi:hypothetical protein
MGFTPKRTVYRLVFEDPDLAPGDGSEGLQVRMYAPPLGEVERLDALMRRLMALATAGEEPSAQDVADGLSLYETLAEYMKDWNVQDESGTPVPATADGFRTQETGLLNQVMRAWMAATTEVDAPLGSGSPATPPPDLSSMPMEPMAASLAS